jgi:hypothetical protein
MSCKYKLVALFDQLLQVIGAPALVADDRLSKLASV